MKILEKKNFIKEEKKKINKDNPYALATKQRILLVVEKKIALKFVIVSLLFLVFIFLLNYFFDNHYFNILMGSWISDIYIKYINFPLSDPDSARYFFSSIPQTLAALIAISFTVLLIYLQISTDKYSIHTVRSLFDGFDAIAVLSVFLITILYSLYNLALVRKMEVTQYPWDTEIKTIFILSVICCLALMLFFYRIIHQLTPEIFIRQSCKRMKDAFILNLDLTQSLYIKNNFYAKEIIKINNIEESFFFGAFDSVDYIYNVKSSKRGFVEDIDTSKIEKCSKLLSSVSDDCRLILVKPITSKITSTSNILGQIKCPDERISSKVEGLINKAYKINLKNDWMLADYKELEPISSFDDTGNKVL